MVITDDTQLSDTMNRIAELEDKLYFLRTALLNTPDQFTDQLQLYTDEIAIIQVALTELRSARDVYLNAG